MEYRRASRDDVDACVENRMEFLTSIREIPEHAAFRAATAAYLPEHITKDDTFIILAVENTEIIASCMTCII